MIREITILDEENFYKLGLQINTNFKNLYNLNYELANNLSTIFVMELNNVFVGFIHINCFTDNIDLINIIVDKKYRKQKIGSQLLEFVILKYQEKKITLEVSTENKIAIHLYKKYGFAQMGIRKGYYNGIDAITMVRE